MLPGQNVITCGADPTGRLDSTPAFRAAIDALPATGGIVYVPAGRYNVHTLTLRKSVSLIGAGGIARTAAPAEGSVTTLVFPSDDDGIVVEAGGVQLEQLALVRAGTGYARRGIHARRAFFARNLYLVRWERGIDLDGRASEGNNANGFRIEHVFAEDCYWATYTRGYDAQAGRFSHIYAFQCHAGIYDSSLTGNGYYDCYVEGGWLDAPYYIDNQSQLCNCRVESPHLPQLAATVQVLQGSPHFTGIPARIDSLPFHATEFAGGERINITVDGISHEIQFEAGDQTPRAVVERINAAFSGTPAVAVVDVFDSALSLRGRAPHLGGSISVAEVAGGSVLPALGFTLGPDGTPAVRRENSGMNRAQIIASSGVSGLAFTSASGPNRSYGSTEQIEVRLAHLGDIAMLWQARGDTGDNHEYALIRVRDLNPASPKQRWAFARASLPSLATLAFTHEMDEMGGDQLLAYRGLWLYGSPAILLSNGVPAETQGRVGDYAWDMAQNPPVRYEKVSGGWTAML